ncbi:hypothetical protein [Novosphingobium taihuense]|uniref:Uncharacterized protein n=1 Tax=Novosphingobium taihuense TaxID=260085 RepID=A0A7W7AES2_9SPHN|nr:hypothetical protein [Novosphingobium taihuense]MBB4615697.1 hypothetical protein [Novosphingobium taihuense]TWH80110.1 hypothetical protein IQ25_03794 [Novosphingobium taihuense]
MTATKRKPKPITAHPLFPVVTALWFATFFGLGSFAIAPAVLEGPVVALGIPALIPAATPPLGFTARVMMAVAMLLAGGGIGFLIGRKLGPKQATAAPRKRAATGFSRRDSSVEAEAPRRMLNPAEDLDDPSLDAPFAEPAPLRRRSLSLADEGQLHVPSELAPLPGHLPWEREEFSVDEETAPHGMTDDPLALELLFQNAQAQVEAVEPAPEVAPAFTTTEPEFAAPQPEPVQHSAPFVTRTAPAAAAPLLQAPVADITPLERAPLESLGLVQMVERLALAISRRTAPRMDVSVLEESSFAQPVRESAPAVSPASVEPLEPAIAVQTPEEPQTERVVRLRPAGLSQVSPMDPAQADLEDEDSDVPGLDRFLRVNQASATAVEDTSPAEPEVAEDRYPSLLDMGPATHRHETLRIDDGLGLAELPESEGEIEPVVVFPGQDSPLLGATRPFERPSILAVPGSPLAAPGRAAPSSPTEQLAGADAVTAPPVTADPEEADRALRAALATLQRMTAQG